MEVMNEELFSKAVKHHGHRLLSFLEGHPILSSLGNVKDMPFEAGRSKTLSTAEIGRNLCLNEFIAQNTTALFSTQNSCIASSVSPRGFFRDPNLVGITPPLEAYLDTPSENRLNKFFDSVANHDLLLCRIRSRRSTELLLYVESFALGNKSRVLHDLFIKAYCPVQEIPSGFNDFGSALLLVYVIEVNHKNSSLTVGMNPPPELFNGIRFGSIEPSSDLNIVHRITLQDQNGHPSSYKSILEQSSGFKNPSNVEYLANELGLSSKTSSLLPSLRHKYNDNFYAKALRARQAHRWAFKSVESGIRYLKSGNNIEAFQCLNQAINIDPQNVEGLVARGALFANLGKYEKAVVDFEKALIEDPFHKNAKQYMCETLMAIGKNQETKNKSEEAIQTYKKVLNYYPNHSYASNSISSLQNSPNTRKDNPVPSSSQVPMSSSYQTKTKSVSDEEYERKVTSFLERTQCKDKKQSSRSNSKKYYSEIEPSPMSKVSSSLKSPTSTYSISNRHNDDSSDSNSPSPPQKKGPLIKRFNSMGDDSFNSIRDRYLTEERISQNADASFLTKEKTRNLTVYESDSSSSRVRSRSRSGSSSRSRYSTSRKRNHRGSRSRSSSRQTYSCERKRKKISRCRLEGSPSRSREGSRHRESRSRSRKERKRCSQSLTKSTIEDDLMGIRDETMRIEKEREEIENRKIRFMKSMRKEDGGYLSPNSIIPGQSNLEDVVAFVDQKRRDKMDKLKKNYS
ncbi:tetratricopeptide repeat protein 14 isoform X2 [Lepeophtheirus salmonis]|nr:tetratricopeptide repeat protein 14-like isoform X2 [Lepeophtheirus salmonis]